MHTRWANVGPERRRREDAESKLREAQRELRLLRRVLKLLCGGGTLPENFSALVAEYCDDPAVKELGLRYAVEHHIGTTI